jgi:hypothetical protein
MSNPVSEKPGPQDIELWSNGTMIGHGRGALANLPDTPAQREACANLVRIQARAVEAQERCDAAEARRDLALEEQKLAEAVVDEARASLISQLCERAEDLGRRLDAFERARARSHLDSLPDPDDPNQGGELSPVGPTTFADPAGLDDQIPAPKDPTGTSLQMDHAPTDQTLPQVAPLAM